jgi:serine/threonine-protein kinase
VIGSNTIHGFRRAAAETDDAGMYRLLGKLGEGGMGEVWSAEHRMLARPAAIKIIRPELLGASAAADTATRRFTREAQATARLQSPNTVHLYDFGATQDGTFFYVMEMLKGMDLEDMVKRYGPIRPERAVHLLIQAADSLQEAHSRSLIHRDIKPGNIHVGCYAGHADWVKVLDFGLVKSTDADKDQTALTMEGVTTGTPAYFPPEMARGAGAADVRSDIYALSAVAYWMLTGQLVFTADTALEMVLQHVQEPPVPPSQRCETPIPPALEKAIMAGLRKKPDERPQTMREFATMLSEVGLAPWTEADANEWWRLHEPDVLSGAA